MDLRGEEAKEEGHTHLSACAGDSTVFFLPSVIVSHKANPTSRWYVGKKVFAGHLAHRRPSLKGDCCFPLSDGGPETQMNACNNTAGAEALSSFPKLVNMQIVFMETSHVALHSLLPL